MIRRVLIFSATMMMAVTTFAQGELSTLDVYYERLYREKFATPDNQRKYNDVKGTPYLNDEFLEGILHLSSGLQLRGEFRLDLYMDQMEFLLKGEPFVIGMADSIRKIEFDDYSVAYIDYLDKTRLKRGFMAVIANGHYAFYNQKKVIFREKTTPKPYQGGELPDRFETGSELIFFKVGDAPAERVSGNKDIIRLCGAQGESVRDYISKEKINIKHTDDINKLTLFLNRKQ